MRTWTRLTTVAAVALMALGLLALPAGSQAEPGPGVTSSPAPLDPDGADGPAAAEGPPVVHSWALAPAGATEPGPTGNRPTLSYEVAPGAQVSDAVTLFNYSNVQLTFQVYATDAYNNEDGQFDLLPAHREPVDVGTWVTLPQRTVVLPARSQATFPITIRVPDDARPGDHAGAVLAASPTQGTGPDGKIIDLDRRTGSRLYVRVAGPLHPELAIEAVRTTYRPSLNPLSGTADVTYRIRNRGNVRLAGTHRVSVSGPFGLLARRAPAEEFAELLPGEAIVVETRLTGVAATGIAFTSVHLDPAPVDGAADLLPSQRRRALTLALPFTLIALAVALGLLLYARRAYQRHQREQGPGSGPGGPSGPGGSGQGAGPAGDPRSPDRAARSEELLV